MFHLGEAFCDLLELGWATFHNALKDTAGWCTTIAFTFTSHWNLLGKHFLALTCSPYSGEGAGQPHSGVALDCSDPLSEDRPSDWLSHPCAPSEDSFLQLYCLRFRRKGKSLSMAFWFSWPEGISVPHCICNAVLLSASLYTVLLPSNVFILFSIQSGGKTSVPFPLYVSLHRGWRWRCLCVPELIFTVILWNHNIAQKLLQRAFHHNNIETQSNLLYMWIYLLSLRQRKWGFLCFQMLLLLLIQDWFWSTLRNY